MEFHFTGSLEEFEALIHAPAEGHDEIIARLDALAAQGEQIMATAKDYLDQLKAKMDTATAAIAAETAVDDSIIALLNSIVASNADLKTRIADLAIDPAVAQQISDLIDANNASIKANTDKLAAAVVANTPSA